MGALGHIGSRMIRELPSYFSDLDIVMIDNMKTQRYTSLFGLTDAACYRFIEGDVTNMNLAPLLKGIDVVIHLAALTDAAASFDQPEEMERVNYKATKKVAEACADAGVPLIHTSSTSVYGTDKNFVDESCGSDDINPQSPYAEAKRNEEILIADMCANGKLQAMSFRFGTIFGTSPGMRFHTAVNKFCWQAVMGQPLSIWKTAYEQKRPYLDLVDAVRAIAFVINNRLFDGKIYNVVTVNATVHEVVDMIRCHVSDVTINFIDNKIMNQLSYCVLNSELSSNGFEMKGDMGMAIKETLELLKNSNVR